MFGWLKNTRIKTMSYAFILFMVVAGALAILTSLRTQNEMNSTEAAWDQFAQVTGAKIAAESDLRDAMGFGGLIHNFKDAVLERDIADLQATRSDQQRAMDAINAYRKAGVSRSEDSALTAITGVLTDYVNAQPTVESMIDDGALAEDIDQAIKIDDAPALNGLAALDSEMQAEKQEAETAVHDSVSRAHTLTSLTAIIVAAMVLCNIAVFVWFARRRVLSPIYRLVEFARRVGSGDLREQMNGLSGDEVGALGAEMNAMVASLRDIAVQTRESVASLTAASTDTLASTKQQAASVEQQFAAIQETTATLDEINQSGMQMSSRAREVAAEAEKAHERSKDGRRAMDDMAQLMDAIEEQTESVASHIVALSEKTQAIGDIIATVNDVAERSQLLALNAAIEAAAAGEGGRSFSVVADEIKTLADQAKEATAQVSSILGEIQKGINASVMSTEESVKRVASGRQQTEGTLKSITDLADMIEASVRAFDQIVASANQQRVGLEQVTEALAQIRTGSEQTAAGTRQIELAVANINSLGSDLGHSMERYAV